MAATLETTEAVDSELIPDARNAGEVLCRSAKFTAPAEIGINSVIEMVPVCDGMMVLDVQLFWTALGSGVLIDVGDSDIDRYYDGVDAAAAGAADLANEGDLATCYGHVYTADDTIDVKILVAVMPKDAILVMHVFYKMLDAIADEESMFG